MLMLNILLTNILLHTLGGSGYWDELFLFGGIGGIVIALLVFSWLEGRKRDKKQKRKKHL